jgi:hypothetical protein
MAGVPSTIFGASLVRHFLEAYSAGTWTDATGTTNASQATSGLRPAASTLGLRLALSCDGVDDGLASGTADVTVNDLTVGFLFRSSTTPAGDTYIAGHGGFTGFNWGVAIRSTGKVGMSNDASTYAESDATVCDGVLRSVVCTVGPTNGLRVFVDGALQATTQPGVTGALTGTTSDSVGIGALLDATGSTTAAPVTGTIANLFVANAEVSSADALLLHRYLMAWAYPIAGMAGRPMALPARAGRRSPAVQRPVRLPVSAPYTFAALSRAALRPLRQPRVLRPSVYGGVPIVSVQPYTFAALSRAALRPLRQPRVPRAPAVPIVVSAPTTPRWADLAIAPPGSPARWLPPQGTRTPPVVQVDLPRFGLVGVLPEVARVVVRLMGPQAPAMLDMVTPPALLARVTLPPAAAVAVAVGPMAPVYVLSVPVVPISSVSIYLYGSIARSMTLPADVGETVGLSGCTNQKKGLVG